jgi:hypothetical protein
VPTEDWYPINRQFDRYPITHKGKALDYLKARGAKVVGSIVETSWQELNKSSPKGRCPTPDEYEAEVNEALAHGATWIIHFSTAADGSNGWPGNYDPTPPDVAARITTVCARLNPPPVTPPPATKPTTAPTAPSALELQVATLRADLDVSNATLAALAEQIPLRGPPRAWVSQTPPEGTGNPLMRPLNHGHGSNIGSIPAPKIDAVSPYDYTEERVRAYAKLCRDGGTIDKSWLGQGVVKVYAGAPVLMDYEGYDDPNNPELAKIGRARPDLSKADVGRLIRKHLDWFRSEAPDVPVGLLGVGYTDDTRVAHDGATFLVGGAYLMAEEWVDRDLATIRAQLVDIRKQYPGRRILAAVNAQFVAERTAKWRPGDEAWTNRGRAPLTPAATAKYVALNRELADELFTWSDAPYAEQVRVLGPELMRGGR